MEKDAFLFFAVGGLWFWLLVIGVTGLMFLWAEVESTFFTVLTIVIGLAVFHFLSDARVFSHIFANPGSTLLFLAGYAAAGVAWSLVKWTVYVKKQRALYDEELERFKGYKNSPDSIPMVGWKGHPEEAQQREHFMESNWPKLVNYKPMAKRNKDRIVSWMVCWPWSMSWAIINDPVKHVFGYVFRKLQGSYQMISDRTFKGAEDSQT